MSVGQESSQAGEEARLLYHEGTKGGETRELHREAFALEPGPELTRTQYPGSPGLALDVRSREAVRRSCRSLPLPAECDVQRLDNDMEPASDDCTHLAGGMHRRARWNQEAEM